MKNDSPIISPNLVNNIKSQFKEVYSGPFLRGFVYLLNRNIEILKKEKIIHETVRKIIIDKSADIDSGIITEDIIKNAISRKPYSGKIKLVKALLIATFGEEWKNTYEKYYKEKNNTGDNILVYHTDDDSNHEKWMEKSISISESENKQGKYLFTGMVIGAHNSLLGLSHRIDIDDLGYIASVEELMPSIFIKRSFLYTTIEPFPYDINIEHFSVKWIVDNNIRVVWIGELNPYLEIRGKGISDLLLWGIEVHFFPTNFRNKIIDIHSRVNPLPESPFLKEMYYTPSPRIKIYIIFSLIFVLFIIIYTFILLYFFTN